VSQRGPFIEGVALLHLIDTAFTIEATADDFICHDELVELFLQVIVLESE